MILQSIDLTESYNERDKVFVCLYHLKCVIQLIRVP